MEAKRSFAEVRFYYAFVNAKRSVWESNGWTHNEQWNIDIGLSDTIL